MVESIFNQTQLAGEAGSLLRIAAEIHAIVTEAKNLWKAQSKTDQLVLLPDFNRPKPEQLDVFDVAEITDEGCWQEAEARVIELLQNHGEPAVGGQWFQRQLFVGDAVRGFAFVDVCRKQFEVVLLNPAFGEASKPSKPLIETSSRALKMMFMQQLSNEACNY